MALCTVSDVESIIGVDLSTTLESTVTNSLIPFADQIIKTYLGSVSYTHLRAHET